MYPSLSVVDMKLGSLKRLSGRLPVSLDVIRTVAGLTLPVRCVVVQGFSVGSCSYQDLCKDLVQGIFDLNESNCIPEFSKYGFDCSCPVNIPPQLVEETFLTEIPDLSQTIAPFMFVGDYEITARLNDANNGHIACYKVQYSIYKV